MIKTHLEVDLDILEQNASELVSKYKNYKYIFGVLKSNAYGHGEYVVNAFIKGGINYICVSYIEEALKVRSFNKKIPILCMQPIIIDDLKKAYDNNITLTVDNMDYLDSLIKKCTKNIKVHLKVDSGMNRLGFKTKEEIKEAYDKIVSCKYIELEGIYTHLATIGLFDNKYDNQVKKFNDALSLINVKKVPIIHFGSSAITIGHDKLPFVNGARFGIALYGYNVTLNISTLGLKNKIRSLRNTYYQKKLSLSPVNANVKLNLKPAISMKTRIIEIKDVNAGEYIGYGATYKAEENIKIAILPIGYYDGIGTSSNRYVLINKKKYYMVGAMSMNMMIIKIDDKVKITDEVTILGEEITPRVLSSFKGGSVVETLLDIGKVNPHYYISNGKVVYKEGE